MPYAVKVMTSTGTVSGARLLTEPRHISRPRVYQTQSQAQEAAKRVSQRKGLTIRAAVVDVDNPGWLSIKAAFHGYPPNWRYGHEREAAPSNQ
jgi:hypothetical protein